MKHQDIIGRKAEIAILDKLMRSLVPEFLIIYGRRRIGKTYLIREYFGNDLVFDFTGSYGTDMKSQLENFFHEYLVRSRGQMETRPPESWSRAFQYLSGYLDSVKMPGQKFVVFIDELPWLDTPRSGFVSALEYFWNQYFSKQKEGVLVGCGSASAWIQKKILRSKGGLHNRVTQRIRLEPFNLAETEQFCRSRRIQLSRYQILQVYMAMGGVPHYLKELVPGFSASQLIDQICFSKTGLLREEYPSLYQSLFNNPEHHLTIIETLGARPNGLTRNDIIHYSGLPDGGTVNRTLEDLLESGFIQRYQPFQKLKKDTIYKLTDLYSLFYLKFIRPSLARNTGSWQMLANSPSYQAWSGYAYETVCMLHVDEIRKAMGISGIYSEISAWKFTGNEEMPGAQIDLLIDRKDQVVNLCEAKFTDKEFVISKSYVSELRKKRSIFSQATGTKKSVFTTLITTYPAFQNKYYLEEIQTEVTMDDLFAGVNTKV